jgi:hypothetical protein
MASWSKECEDYFSLLSPSLSIDPHRSSKMWIDLFVPISSAHDYYHDMSTEVPWNQNPFLLVCVSLVLFVAFLILLL